MDGEKHIRIAGEDVTVKASIHTINGFSAHGDRDDLLAWASNFTTAPLFLVTHGEPSSSKAFSETLQKAGMRTAVPFAGQEIPLEPNGAAVQVIQEKAVILNGEKTAAVLTDIRPCRKLREYSAAGRSLKCCLCFSHQKFFLRRQGKNREKNG